jgi:hypothetical protein
MKPASRKPSERRRPTPRQIRGYLEALQHEHQFAWQDELLSNGPQWVVMLGLHLRLVELERLAEGMQELLP